MNAISLLIAESVNESTWEQVARTSRHDVYFNLRNQIWSQSDQNIKIKQKLKQQIKDCVGDNITTPMWRQICRNINNMR